LFGPWDSFMENFTKYVLENEFFKKLLIIMNDQLRDIRLVTHLLKHHAYITFCRDALQGIITGKYQINDNFDIFELSLRRFAPNAANLS